MNFCTHTSNLHQFIAYGFLGGFICFFYPEITNVDVGHKVLVLVRLAKLSCLQATHLSMWVLPASHFSCFLGVR